MYLKRPATVTSTTTKRNEGATTTTTLNRNERASTTTTTNQNERATMTMTTTMENGSNAMTNHDSTIKQQATKNKESSSAEEKVPDEVVEVGVQQQKNKKARTTKPLPKALANFTPEDIGSFVIIDKEDPNDAGKVDTIAVAVKLKGSAAEELHDNDDEYKLDNLNLDQLRRLASQVGCKGVGSSRKMLVLKAIALKATYVKLYNKNPTVQTVSDDEILLLSGCRLINTIFGSEILPLVRMANDKKDRADHETKNTEKMVWIRVADKFNSTDGDDIIQINNFFCSIESEQHLKEHPFKDINLSKFLPVSAQDAKAFVKACNEGRRHIKEMMAESGHHSNDPFTYLDRAISRMKAKIKINKFVLYYYHLHCDGHSDIDFKFCVTLPDSVKGSSEEGDMKTPNATKKPSTTTTAEALKQTSDSFKTFQKEMIAVQKDKNKILADMAKSTQQIEAKKVLVADGVLTPNRRARVIEDLLNQAGIENI